MRSGELIAGRFELGDVAGAGGMGRVHRARDRESGAAVAVKLLAGGAEQHRERFAWEARLLEQLRHPSIVRHVAHGITDGGELFLAMEWLEGEDLAARLERGPLSVAETCALAGGLLGGLAAAHGLGVIHRDVKPSNVFLEAGDPARAKLLDFGIARLHGAPITRTGHVLGTIGYMAPEQARGERDLDVRVDVFSAGCVLFECLAGRPAFRGEHPVAVLARILHEEPPRLSAIRGDVPPALDELLARAMAKRADDRPADAGALARAIARLDGGAADAAAAPRPTLTEREQRRLYVIVDAVLPSVETLAQGATQAPGEFDALRRQLQRDAGQYGADLELLADGSAVATLTGTGSATDHAAAAARCALALRRALPAAPIALATGSGLLAGKLPVGEVVDRAAALLRDAGSSIRTDDAMAGLLDARFDLGGGSAGFELRGERDPGLAGRTLLGKPSPCVGRERELAALEACYRECAADELARAVVVTAPPGVGKSRLLRELIARIQSAPAEAPPELWIARGDPTSAGAPFGMLAQLVRRAAGIQEGEPAAVRAGKLRDRVRRSVPAARADHVTERLAELAGVPAEAESAELREARKDAASLGEQLRRAFVDFLGAECAARPVAVVLEDLHWGDVATVKAIDAALRELRERRLLVIALARPEVHELFPRLWAGRPVTRLDLGALPRRAGERLVRAMLGDAVPAAVVDKVLALAAGNAFYLEELIRAVAAGRAEELPETVLAMVDARIEALDAEQRRVLRAASVFGEVFWRGGLAELLGAAAAPGRVEAMLAELLEQEVIERREGPRFPEHDEYGFRHGLVREAAYRRLTSTDRTLGHRLAGDWLERAGETDASVLAAHFDRGDAPARAVPLYVRAGQVAVVGASFDRAIAMAERGVACGAAGPELGRLRLVQTEAHAMRFELAACARVGTEAMALLERGTGEWFGAVGGVAMASALCGERDRAAALLAELTAAEPGPGAITSYMMGCCWTMMVLVNSGLYAAAAGLLARAEDLQARLAPGDRAAAAFVAQSRWYAACTDEDPWRRLVLARRAAALHDEAGYAGFAVRAYADLGVSLHGVGAHGEAERALAQARELADRTGTVHGTTFVQLHLGAALLEGGRLDEAEAHLRDVEEACRRAGEVHYAARAHVALARLHARRGEPAAAEREARRATDYPHARPVRAYANAVLAEALLAQGRPADALDAARQGQRLFDALGGVYEGDALIHLALAEALAAAGHPDEAARALAGARERLLARAARIEDAALRASFLGLGDHARTLAHPPTHGSARAHAQES